MRSDSVGRRMTAILVAMLMLVTACARGEGEAVAPKPHLPADPELVQTATGAVRGVVTPDHRLFAGIPYAAPPVGPLRWQPPAPALPWSGVRDATQNGPRCMQDTSDLEMGRKT